MKSSGLILIQLFLTTLAFSQTLTQTIRGNVLDVDSRLPLIGATIYLTPGPSPQREGSGTVTDENGNFRLENVPVGRADLAISYIGYENLQVPNIVVNSGKEVVLNLLMQESAVKMAEVTVTATRNKGEALNEMAMLSARSISPEETNRYAGGFNDPSRILSNFAGITSTQDGSNDIIVRGNSPKYVQWRLEGEQITNPNHFGDQSAVGGSVSILNNNLLAASDFYTGAFTAEFGDVLSGVYDVRLRNGNNEQVECVFGFGLLGTELTMEGPLGNGGRQTVNGGRPSFLLNYRYSTAGLLSQLGLLGDFSGVLKFQDATFKLVFPTEKMGVFTLYGMGGLSSFGFEDVTPAIWVIPGDNAIEASLRNDFDKKSHLINTGLKHSINLGKKGLLNSSLTYSNERIQDDITEAGIVKIYDENNEFLRDSVISRRQQFEGDLRKPTYRMSTTYNHKFNARHKLQLGVKYTLFAFDFAQNQWPSEGSERVSLVDFDENVGTLRNFASWKWRASERFSVVAGLHNMNLLLNSKSTLEPRLALEWQAAPQSTLRLGYGKHSTMESIHHYFTKTKQPDGSYAEVNRDLGLLKADHFVLGFEQKIGKNLRAKLEAYYQRLYDLPVDNLDTSYFATVVEGLDFRYVDLVNEGKGRNYGIELTLEKFFSRNYYFMVNASLYESKYTALDGKERNTPFNGNYLVNLLGGKEFPGLGRKKNQTLGLNFKAYLAGGRKIIPLLRDAQGNLAVDPEKGQVWDYSKAFENSLEDAYQIQVSASYKWNKPRATHELFLNLDNLTNNKGRIMEFYDENEPGKVGYMTQFGFFPNLMYRVYFLRRY
ncbi:MAG: TonB-dependent receptor [Saprospiraceae bacterium]|nr:TonB-dependent receptor [Saprospiraceae bacterium]